MNMADPAEMLRIAGLLERLVLVRKLPIRKTEKQLGLSNGYLARIFSGKIELKYRHILDILAAVNVEPRVFFELAYGSQDGGRVPDLFRQVRHDFPEPEPLPPIDSQEFESRVIDLLVKLEVLKKPPAAKKPARRRPPK